MKKKKKIPDEVINYYRITLLGKHFIERKMQDSKLIILHGYIWEGKKYIYDKEF